MTIEDIVVGDPKSTSDKEARIIAEAIRETDWEETAVLDVVKYRPVAPGDDPPLPEYEVERYAAEVPNYSAYQDGRRTFEVHRITEAWCEQAGIDPETGERVDDEDEGEGEGEGDHEDRSTGRGVDIEVEDRTGNGDGADGENGGSTPS